MRSLLAIAFAVAFPAVCLAAEPLVVHEWGTFTQLQDGSGRAIGGVNVDDEPVPSFVHTLASSRVANSPSVIESQFSKGVRACHPDVMVRLETPVVYFHLPAGTTAPITLDVAVKYNGGWLTQFYPDAVGVAPGMNADGTGRFDRNTVGTLEWKGLQVGVEADGPKTSERVWTAPRDVKGAAVVRNAKGESEKYLFYRGVGTEPSAPLLQIVRDDERLRLSGFGTLLPPSVVNIDTRKVLLIDQRPDGRGSVRVARMDQANPVPDGATYSIPATTSERDLVPDAPAKARGIVREWLLADGLFEDEADAMLNTWEASWFKSPGVRVLYAVPRRYADATLPITFSVPVKLERATIGRIELITPEQRATLKRLAATTDPADARKLYTSLGRFREAIARDALARDASPMLTLVLANP